MYQVCVGRGFTIDIDIDIDIDIHFRLRDALPA
jgi:hypothetical protein